MSVSPSGLARATCWLPILPEAPATLSTTTGWPSFALSFSARKRPIMSGPVPGVKGTTMCNGWSGQANAVLRARGAARPPAAAERKTRRCMRAFKQWDGEASIQLMRALPERYTFYKAIVYLTHHRAGGIFSLRRQTDDRQEPAQQRDLP